jgi:hypothetical protein
MNGTTTTHCAFHRSADAVPTQPSKEKGEGEVPGETAGEDIRRWAVEEEENTFFIFFIVNCRKEKI